MVKRLRPTQERILLAGPPPRCDDFGSDFMAWYAAQDRWYAAAVESGKLPGPKEQQRRVLWQQATKRFACAETASRALQGDQAARAAQASQTAQRRSRVRPPLKGVQRSRNDWRQLHRERKEAGLTPRRITVALSAPSSEGSEV